MGVLTFNREFRVSSFQKTRKAGELWEKKVDTEVKAVHIQI